MSTIKRGAEHALTFPMFDRAGRLASGLAVTAEVSKDGAAFVQSQNPVAEIGTSGIYRLVLTPAEMDAASVAVRVSAPGALVGHAQIDTELLRNDEVLTTPLAALEQGTSFRTLLGAASKLVNRTRLAGSTLEIYATDDATILGTQTVVTNASQPPVVEVDTT